MDGRGENRFAKLGKRDFFLLKDRGGLCQII